MLLLPLLIIIILQKVGTYEKSEAYQTISTGESCQGKAGTQPATGQWGERRSQTRVAESVREEEGVGYWEQAQNPFKEACDKFTIISFPLQSPSIENPEFGPEVNIHKP
jgi:hypothetical protein